MTPKEQEAINNLERVLAERDALRADLTKADCENMALSDALKAVRAQRDAMAEALRECVKCYEEELVGDEWIPDRERLHNAEAFARAALAKLEAKHWKKYSDMAMSN